VPPSPDTYRPVLDESKLRQQLKAPSRQTAWGFSLWQAPASLTAAISGERGISATGRKNGQWEALSNANAHSKGHAFTTSASAHDAPETSKTSSNATAAETKRSATCFASRSCLTMSWVAANSSIC